MKFLFSLAVIIFTFAIKTEAQLFYNNGADVAVTGGGIMWIGGAAENADGLLSNAGQTTIHGYFRNGSLATGGNSTGEYIVYGDWENNNTFTADQSIVRLPGGFQYITGSQVTTFYDLSTENGGSVKSQTLDAYVSHLLNLNDCELATNDYNMTVTNSVSASVQHISGFVSSTGPGRLIRYMNSTNTYLFPVGWNNLGTIWYRPIEFTPSVNDNQHVAVRMAFGEATNEGYDINIKEAKVDSVNRHYFHLIKQFGSTAPADLSVYYSTTMEGFWGTIARWQNVPQWEDIDAPLFTAGNPLSHRTRANWTDNGQEPHILANLKELKDIYAFPNVFSPNSPNTENAGFHIINQLGTVTLLDLKIWNRWGEPVFDYERDGTTCFDGSIQSPCWNGYFQGKLQMMGNYVYQANVKINSTGQTKEHGGNLSLLW